MSRWEMYQRTVGYAADGVGFLGFSSCFVVPIYAVGALWNLEAAIEMLPVILTVYGRGMRHACSGLLEILARLDPKVCGDLRRRGGLRREDLRHDGDKRFEKLEAAGKDRGTAAPSVFPLPAGHGEALPRPSAPSQSLPRPGLFPVPPAVSVHRGDRPYARPGGGDRTETRQKAAQNSETRIKILMERRRQ